jgi:hypothetical protein
MGEAMTKGSFQAAGRVRLTEADIEPMQAAIDRATTAMGEAAAREFNGGIPSPALIIAALQVIERVLVLDDAGRSALIELVRFAIPKMLQSVLDDAGEPLQ